MPVSWPEANLLDHYGQVGQAAKARAVEPGPVQPLFAEVFATTTAARHALRAQDLLHLRFDLSSKLGVVLERLLRVLSALPEARALIREPGAGLLDDIVFDTEIDEQTN